MSFTIHTTDGRVLVIHTEVGDGLARVIVEEAPAVEADMEGDDA